jgi:hypothetical protein
MGIIEVVILNQIVRLFAFGFLCLGLVQASTPTFGAGKTPYVYYFYTSDAKVEVQIRIQLAPNDDGYVVYKYVPSSEKPKQLGPLNIHGRTILDEDDLRIMISLHLQAGGNGGAPEGESAIEALERRVNEIIGKVRKLRAESFSAPKTENGTGGARDTSVPEQNGYPFLEPEKEKPKQITPPKRVKSASYKKKLKVVKKKHAQYDVNEHDDAVRLNFGY